MTSQANQVPILNLSGQYKELASSLEKIVLEVLRSGNYILGEQVSQLENSVASLCSARFGIGVANGTDALYLALWSLDVGPGDEVITTPFSFAATVEAIMLRGAKPVFVDIDPTTFNIDPEKIAPAITKKTKAIIPVHLYGLPANMEPIMAVARANNIPVVEDNAQGIGALYRGYPTGSFGELACTSFYPTKNLGAAGDAGMIVTSNEDLVKRIKGLRAHGSHKRYYHVELGVNSRLDEIQAAILNVKFNHLKRWNDRRMEIARVYNKKLCDVRGIVAPLVGTSDEMARKQIVHVWHQYTIRVENQRVDDSLTNASRDKLVANLAARGIGSMCYYPVPLHLQEAYQLGYKFGDFPHTERAATEVLSLPMYSELTDAQIDSVVGAIADSMVISPVGIASPVIG